MTGGTRPTTGTVVSATPRTASTVLADQVDDDRVRSVGTRFRGGRMYEATQSGFWTAARIGRSTMSDPRDRARRDHRPDLEQATTFFAEAFGAEYLYDMLDEPLGGPAVEAGLGVPQGAVIKAIRMLRLGNGPNIELFTYTGVAQRDPVRPQRLRDPALLRVRRRHRRRGRAARDRGRHAAQRAR